jgi:hypothetical protein
MIKSSELSLKGEFFSKKSRKAMDDEYVPYEYF